MKDMNKFYVGAKHIGAAVARGVNAGCIRASREEAVEEARNMIRNNEADCLVVVEIVAVVRRDVPIIVEEV